MADGDLLGQASAKRVGAGDDDAVLDAQLQEGVAAGADLINDEQRNRILKLIDSTSADTERFCRFFKIDAVPALPSKRFDEAVKMLEGKRGAK